MSASNPSADGPQARAEAIIKPSASADELRAYTVPEIAAGLSEAADDGKAEAEAKAPEAKAPAANENADATEPG